MPLGLSRTVSWPSGAVLAALRIRSITCERRTHRESDGYPTQRQAALEHGHATLDPGKAREGTRAVDLRYAHAPLEMSQITPGWVRDHLARHAAAVLPGKRLSLAGPQDPQRARRAVAPHPRPVTSRGMRP